MWYTHSTSPSCTSLLFVLDVSDGKVYPKMGVEYEFSTGVHIDPRDPWNISGGPQVKHDEIKVLYDILVVHEENQLRIVFTIKYSISTVILVGHEKS